jgi:hypothetical protein
MIGISDTQKQIKTPPKRGLVRRYDNSDGLSGFLFSAPCHESKQAKAGQQHRVGFGFGDGSSGRKVKVSLRTGQSRRPSERWIYPATKILQSNSERIMVTEEEATAKGSRECEIRVGRRR